MGRGAGQEGTGWTGTASVPTPTPHDANSASSPRDCASGLHSTSKLLAGRATFAPFPMHLAGRETFDPRRGEEARVAPSLSRPGEQQGDPRALGKPSLVSTRTRCRL